MQKKLTWFLTVSAALLFAFILFYERKLPDRAERQLAPSLLPGLHPSSITALQLSFPSGGSVRAQRTDRGWTLLSPSYPAQQSSIETFVTNIAQLRRLDSIPSRELRSEGLKAFGFDPPRTTVQVETSTNQFRFEIGSTAPLTNNLYIRLQPSGEVFLAQADLLRALPRTTNDWRSRDLLSQVSAPFDHLEVRAGQRMFELAINPANNQWQISKPFPARGDQASIAELLARLGRSQVSEFITDAPPDLERYGLQSPSLQLALMRGTNPVFSVHFGSASTNLTNHVYARLNGTAIVALEQDLPRYLEQPYKAFHDPRLLSFNPAMLHQVEVRSLEQFMVIRQADGRWTVGDVPADLELLGRFLGAVLDFQILDIVKEVPTDADLQVLGLRNPVAAFAFTERATNLNRIVTNSVRLHFGAQQADRVFVRRSDEAPVYVTELSKLYLLPRSAFEMRDRQIWNFQADQVTRVILTGVNIARGVARSEGRWVADPVADAAIDEIVHRLSQLSIGAWIAKGEDRKRVFGIVPGAPVLEVHLGDGPAAEVRRIEFGRDTLRHDVYGTTELEGAAEPLIFEFPGEIFHLILQHFPIRQQ